MVVREVLDTPRNLPLFIILVVLFIIRVIVLPNLLRPFNTLVGNDRRELNTVRPIMSDDFVLAALLAKLLPGEVSWSVRDLQLVWSKESVVRR